MKAKVGKFRVFEYYSWSQQVSGTYKLAKFNEENKRTYCRENDYGVTSLIV